MVLKVLMGMNPLIERIDKLEVIVGVLKRKMMIDSDKLIDILKQGIVLIKFRSLKSGKVYEREYTTHRRLYAYRF